MVNRTVLDNGIRLVSEEIDHVRSVSLGLWVEGGSRDEQAKTNGAAHFIEHMLFKGTTRRSSFDIATAVDSVGGVMNAFTGKELTSYSIKVPDHRLELAVDLLADIVTNSRFAEGDIEREREVILQEIKMVEDTPDEYIHDIFDGLIWKGHPLGMPILGSKERVASFRRNDLLSFFSGRYRGERIVVTAAGRLKHGRLVELVEKGFAALPPTGPRKVEKAPRACPGVEVRGKELEQVHLVVGVPAPSALSEERYAAFLLNALLGGSMSSWLFQEIREKRGLAYAVSSTFLPYRDTGVFLIYAATGAESVGEVYALVLEGMDRFSARLLPPKKLSDAKELLKGNLLMGMESTDTRMSTLARNEIYFGRHLPVEEVVDRLNAVGRQEIRDLASRLFRPDALTAAALGPISEHDLGA